MVTISGNPSRLLNAEEQVAFETSTLVFLNTMIPAALAQSVSFDSADLMFQIIHAAEDDRQLQAGVSNNTNEWQSDERDLEFTRYSTTDLAFQIYGTAPLSMPLHALTSNLIAENAIEYESWLKSDETLGATIDSYFHEVRDVGVLDNPSVSPSYGPTNDPSSGPTDTLTDDSSGDTSTSSDFSSAVVGALAAVSFCSCSLATTISSSMCKVLYFCFASLTYSPVNTLTFRLAELLRHLLLLLVRRQVKVVNHRMK